jgi:hypothetical protein
MLHAPFERGLFLCTCYQLTLSCCGLWVEHPYYSILHTPARFDFMHNSINRNSLSSRITTRSAETNYGFSQERSNKDETAYLLDRRYFATKLQLYKEHQNWFITFTWPWTFFLLLNISKQHLSGTYAFSGKKSSWSCKRLMNQFWRYSSPATS